MKKMNLMEEMMMMKMRKRRRIRKMLMMEGSLIPILKWLLSETTAIKKTRIKRLIKA